MVHEKKKTSFSLKDKLFAFSTRCYSLSLSKIIHIGAIWTHVLPEDGWSPAPRNSGENSDALEADDSSYSGPREGSGEGPALLNIFLQL